MAEYAPEKHTEERCFSAIPAEWPTILRKNWAPAAISCVFCSFYLLFYRWPSIFLCYLRPDLLADLGPEYAIMIRFVKFN